MFEATLTRQKNEIAMISTVNGHYYKYIFILITLWLGCSNLAFAVTYGEVNAQRAQAGMPLLKGNYQTDFQILIMECSGGNRYSCTLAQQLTNSQKQQRVPVYIPPEPQIERLPPLGEPGYAPHGYSGGGGGSHCAECLNYHGNSDVEKAFCASYLAGSNCR
jgi:hypothetical protein